MPLASGSHIFTRDPNCNGVSNPNTGETLGSPSSEAHNTHCDIASKAFDIPEDFLKEIKVSSKGSTNNSVKDAWTEGNHWYKIEAWVHKGARYLEYKTWVRTDAGTTSRPANVRYRTDIKTRKWKIVREW